MLSSIQIRRLTSSDIALMRSLNAMFGKAFDDADSYDGAPPADAWLASLLTRQHIVALAAVSGQEAVGGLIAYELDKFERARRELYIYDLAVSEPYRRRGIATALIEHLRNIAAHRNVWVIYVQADYSDPPAIALYEKLGTREEVLHFDIAVPQIASDAPLLPR